MIPNYSAQDWKLLTKKDKDELAEELKKEDKTIEDYEVEIKKGWPSEVRLPPAKWGKRR